MSARRWLLAIALAGTVPTASGVRADVWQHASGSDLAATKREIYDLALSAGDELASQAHQDGLSIANTKHLLTAAADAYRNAAAARPEQAEPYFRLGWMLFTFYFQLCDHYSMPTHSVVCNPDQTNHVVGQQVVDAWDAAEARAPLDPRFSGEQDYEYKLLFERAVLNTKLADTNTPADAKHLEAAARDYQTALSRSTADSSETTISNLAETYMMLGQLDEAIDLYSQAVRHGSDVTTSYGLAVALDRDERGEQARAIIIELGPTNFEEFRKRIMLGQSFYVPVGEKYYYLALAEEALGNPEDAIRYWNDFIQSGAHPRFQPRAAANRDALIAKRRAKPAPPPMAYDIGF